LNEQILPELVLLMALGAAAQWLAWRIRVPSIFVLLVVGFLSGPVFGLLDPDALLGPVTLPLVSLGAAVVLFEGGLSASWSDMRSVAQPVRRLITLGLLTTWLGVTVAARFALGIGWELAALLGAILVVTGPTVIGPLLQHARPRGRVGRILKFEGILNDPLGAILAVLVFQVIQTEQVETAVSLVILSVAKAALWASALGIGAAFGYTFVRKRDWLPESLQNAVLLPLVLGVYALAGAVQHESGLLAVTIMGIALASQRRVNMEASVEFTSHARTLLISVLFVLLAARMQLSKLA
jgi:NhaP-type Na+/H+ or K+/H+ antiporter